MIAFASGMRVWLATGHTDMRKGFDTLALLVQETLKRDPHICVGRGYVSAWSRSR
jgi:transposase